jgi:hypothetical protein
MKCARPWSQRCLFSLVWSMVIAITAYPCTGQEGGDASGRSASKGLTVGDLLTAQGGALEVGECAVLLPSLALLKIECPPMFTYRHPPDDTITVRWLPWGGVRDEQGQRMQFGLRRDGVVVWRTHEPSAPPKE